jgi:hypothetical protein
MLNIPAPFHLTLLFARVCSVVTARMRLRIVFLALVSAFGMRTYAQPPTEKRTPQADVGLREALRAHESTLALVQRVAFTFTCRLDYVAGSRVQHDDFVTRCARDSGRERLQEQHLENEEQSAGTAKLAYHDRDVLSEGSKSYRLWGWDPMRPKAIAPGNQSGVKGTIEPRTASPGLYIDPFHFLLLTFGYPTSDARQTLSEFVKNSARVEWRGKVRIGERTLLQLRAYWPGADGNPPDGSYHDIFFDPSIGFLVRRTVEHVETLGSRAQKGVPFTPTDRTTEIAELRDFGDGVFFPTSVVFTIQHVGDSEPYLRRTCAVTDLTVNQPLPQDAFDFRFPANLLVQTYPPVDGKVKTELWGPDNKPIREIRTVEEFAALAGVPPTAAARGRSTTWIVLFAAMNVAVVALIAFYILRKRRKV